VGGGGHIPGQTTTASEGLISAVKEVVHATAHNNMCNVILLVCVIMIVRYCRAATGVKWEV